MKFRPVYALCLLITPFLVAALMMLGSRYDASLGGRLLQIAGGFIGLGWTTWMFLEVGRLVTQLFGAAGGGSQIGQTQAHAAEPPTPKHPPLRRAA